MKSRAKCELLILWKRGYVLEAGQMLCGDDVLVDTQFGCGDHDLGSIPASL